MCSYYSVALILQEAGQIWASNSISFLTKMVGGWGRAGYVMIPLFLNATLIFSASTALYRRQKEFHQYPPPLGAEAQWGSDTIQDHHRIIDQFMLNTLVL